MSVRLITALFILWKWDVIVGYGVNIWRETNVSSVNIECLTNNKETTLNQCYDTRCIISCVFRCLPTTNNMLVLQSLGQYRHMGEYPWLIIQHFLMEQFCKEHLKWQKFSWNFFGCFKKLCVISNQKPRWNLTNCAVITFPIILHK